MFIFKQIAELRDQLDENKYKTPLTSPKKLSESSRRGEISAELRAPPIVPYLGDDPPVRQSNSSLRGLARDSGRSQSSPSNAVPTALHRLESPSRSRVQSPPYRLGSSAIGGVSPARHSSPVRQTRK